MWQKGIWISKIYLLCFKGVPTLWQIRSRHQYKTILKKCCMKIWHLRFSLVVFRVVSRGIKKIATSPCGQIRNTFFVHFSWRCKQNVMSTKLNYHNYWGNYTWLSIYISKIKISWKLWTNVLFFLHFSVFFMKNVWGYPYLKTHMIKKSFYWK